METSGDSIRSFLGHFNDHHTPYDMVVGLEFGVGVEYELRSLLGNWGLHICTSEMKCS